MCMYAWCMWMFTNVCWHMCTCVSILAVAQANIGSLPLSSFFSTLLVWSQGVEAATQEWECGLYGHLLWALESPADCSELQAVARVLGGLNPGSMLEDKWFTHWASSAGLRQTLLTVNVLLCGWSHRPCPSWMEGSTFCLTLLMWDSPLYAVNIIG